MKKFECNYCANPCVLTFDSSSNNVPRFCPYLTTQPTNWHEVKEEACKVSMQDNGESIQDNKLPDWCKVGAVGYDDINGVYFEVIKVNDDSFRAKSIGSSDSCTSLYFNEFCSEARKRPFNEKEMKALVGKVLETTHVVLLVNAYRELTGDISTAWGNYTAEALMDKGFIINGKPCFKLEHLNEKGEWVE